MPFKPKEPKPQSGKDCKDFKPLSETINSICKHSQECDFRSQNYTGPDGGMYCYGIKYM